MFESCSTSQSRTVASAILVAGPIRNALPGLRATSRVVRSGSTCSRSHSTSSRTIRTCSRRDRVCGACQVRTCSHVRSLTSHTIRNASRRHDAREGARARTCIRVHNSRFRSVCTFRSFQTSSCRTLYQMAQSNHMAGSLETSAGPPGLPLPQDNAVFSFAEHYCKYSRNPGSRRV